jgi:hypothetical protein
VLERGSISQAWEIGGDISALGYGAREEVGAKRGRMKG